MCVCVCLCCILLYMLEWLPNYRHFKCTHPFSMVLYTIYCITRHSVLLLCTFRMNSNLFLSNTVYIYIYIHYNIHIMFEKRLRTNCRPNFAIEANSARWGIMFRKFCTNLFNSTRAHEVRERGVGGGRESAVVPNHTSGNG